jgi:hypothetical protein
MFSRWKLEPGQGSEAAPVHVQQMWVQTWLGPRSREERVAMRLTTEQESIRVKLPTPTLVRQRSIQAAFDGQEITPSSVQDPRYVVLTLPAASRGRACVLELYYALEPPEPSWGLVDEELQTAKIEESVAPRRVYWQLALPQDQHLLTMPTSLTPEMSWTTEHGFFSQKPVMDQRQLEAWMRASRQGPLPRAANEYLFGALGQWPTMSIVAAPRRLIVAFASGLALIVGLLLIHVPRARSRTFLFVLAIAVAAGSVVAPQIAVLAAQGAALGLLIVSAAGALAWLTLGRPQFVAPRTAVSAARESSLARPALAHTATPHVAIPRSDRSSRVTSTAPAVTHAVEARP